jgi:parvulin-like peptidyl-prolyl isomerase
MKKSNERKWKRGLLALTLAAALCLSLAACGGSESGAVARVNGVDITEEQLDAFTELMFIIQGYDFSVVTDETIRDQLKGSFLDRLVEIQVLRLHYEGKIPLEDIEADTRAQMEEVDKEAELAASFREKGITDEIVRYPIELYYYHQMAQEEAGDDKLPGDAEIQEYYRLHEQEFLADEQRRVSHILVGDETHKAEDKALLEEIRGKIASGQESFEDMAKEYSRDGSGASGGDLGFAGKGDYVPEFEAAAFSLPVDELSEVIESEYGFHILKVTEIQEQTIDTVYESVKQQLIDEVYAELYAEKVDALTDEAEIEYLDARYPAPADREDAGAEEAPEDQTGAEDGGE